MANIKKWFKPNFDVNKSFKTPTNDQSAGTPVKNTPTKVSIKMKKTPVKKWFKPNFDVNESFKTPTNDYSASIAVKNTPKTSQTLTKSLDFKEISKVNLLDKVAPKTVSDLAVHPKKIQEVEEWLKYNVLYNNKISVLLLTGPTGSGKTTTVQVLCKTMNIKIIEWINAIDIDYEEFKGPGQTTKFTEFLVQSSRYPSLIINNNKKQIVLVEDFPNSLVYNPGEFENVLEYVFKKYLELEDHDLLKYSRFRILCNIGKYSAVFICTETKDNSSNLGHKLFPEFIKTRYGIGTISFNSASVTLLKNALQRTNAIIQEQFSDIYQCPDQNAIDTIVNTSMGDIRSAVNYFNFACLKGSAILPTTIQITQQSGAKRKRKDKDKGTLTNMSKDESLGLLHGVGRVLYPKRIETKSSWRFERKPESIVDQFISMPTLFTMFLHENYPKYLGEFSDVAEAAEYLSFADLLLSDWRDDNVTTYGLWTAIMGLMVANKNALSKWNPVEGPKHLKIKYEDQYYDCRKLESVDIGYFNIIKPSG